MRRDPRVRKDGLCHVCLKPRRPERSKRYGEGHADLDSFCSSTCARKFHGNELPVVAQQREQGGHQGYMRR